VVVEDARFEFKEHQMQSTVVDASHVAMIDMRIDAAAFETWDIEEADLALELRKIKELISLGGADDMIEMAYTKDSGVLTLNLGKIDRNIRPLDASTVNSPNLPNIDIPSSIEINGASLSQALRAAKHVGDLVNFSIDANSFTVHVQGQTDSVTVSFAKDELESLTCAKPARSQYSLTYLVPLSKVFGSLGTVKLGFGESFPLRLEFSFNDGAGEVVYFLAPRVETDY
jgi:proliferating cell nuclear antigen